MDVSPPASAARFASIDYPRDALRGAAVILLLLCWAVAAFLLARRVGGGFVHPLSTPAMLLVAVLLLALSLAIRSLWRSAGRIAGGSDARRHSLEILVRWGPTPAVLLTALTLSLPQASLAALTVLWIAAINGEVWAISGTSNRKHRPGKPQVLHPSPPDSEAPANQEALIAEMIRTRDEHGREQLSGRVRAEFAAGERVAVLHLVFCPAFRKTPDFQVEHSAGPTARIKTDRLLPHGARIELRRSSENVEPAQVWIEFAAGGMPLE